MAERSWKYADPTFPPAFRASKKRRQKDFDLNNGPRTAAPLSSPYGDNWDALWLGHCGSEFPNAKTSDSVPLGRVVHKNDLTVPQTQHLRLTSPYSVELHNDELELLYENHTRVIHHVAETTCSLAYAVSQAGARRLLFDTGIRELSGPYDNMLSEFCEGVGDRRTHVCLTSQPALFKQHEDALKLPEVAPSTENMVLSAPFTPHIRLSTRINLINGLEGDKLIDSFPDNSPAVLPEIEHDDYPAF